MMLEEDQCPLPDTHGQYRFNYRHPNIPAGMETEMLLRAFRRDFEVNGPSLLRVLRTTLAGWRRYKNHPNARIRRRFREEIRGMVSGFSAVAGATESYYRDNPTLHPKMKKLLDEIKSEFGWGARFYASLGGRYVLRKIRAEEARLAQGWTYEPPTFYEVNDAVAPDTSAGAGRCSYVIPRADGAIAAGVSPAWEKSVENNKD